MVSSLKTKEATLSDRKVKHIPNELFIKTGLEILKQDGNFKLGKELVERAIEIGIKAGRIQILSKNERLSQNTLFSEHIVQSELNNNTEEID